MNTKIKIKEESAEFLRHHLYGGCPEDIQARFSHSINLDDDAKQALKLVLRAIGFDEVFSLTYQQVCLVQRALSKFRCNVSVSEMNLVDYISLFTNSNDDRVMIEMLERSYNRTVAQQS